MNNNRINRWAASFGMNVIIRYKWIFFLIIILLVGIGFSGTKRLVMDSSNESFLPEGDAALVMNDRFKEIFGSEEFVFVYIEAEDVFRPEVLHYIRNLGRDLEENLPFIKDVMSLTDVDYSEARGDQLIIDDLIGEEIPKSEESLREIRRKALSKKVYLDRIVSADGKRAGIAVSFERIPESVYIRYRENFSTLEQADGPPESVVLRKDIFTAREIEARANEKWLEVEDPRKLIAPALGAIMERHRTDDFLVLATGIPIVDFEADRVTSVEGARFGLIALVVSIILLVLIFRNFTAVVAPFLVLLSTLVILYGLMGWFRMPLTMGSMVIAPLILVISVSYSIHVINHFRNRFNRTGLRRESLSYAFQHSAWPCFLTALTTGLGFISFLVVPLRPIRHLGIACAVGVFVAFVLVMIIVPGFYSFGKDKSLNKKGSRKSGAGISMGDWTVRWADWVLRNAGLVTIVSLLILVTLMGFSLKARVDTDSLNMMGDRLNFIRDTKYITERLGGLYSIELMMELPRDGMAKDPAVLEVLEDITREVKKWELVTDVSSINDVLKDLNMTMNRNDPAYFKIPGTRELVAQYLLLYEMSGGESVEDWVDYDYRYLRLSIQLGKVESRIHDRLMALVKDYNHRLPEGTTINLVGDAPILLRTMDLLIWGQLKSILVALAVISLIMILILKSWRVGLLSMVPNILPVIVIAGVMGLLDMPLDMLTVMIAPMIIGIAVDDTVHYVIHFRQEKEQTECYHEANRGTFAKVGRAIVFTSVILSIGFAIMGMSSVQSMFHMAVLSSAGIISALLADLIITPVLFVYLKPFKKRRI